MDHASLADHRDWLLEAPRDLELQAVVDAEVLDGDWSRLAADTDRPLVSTDLRARPESVVMACPETKLTAGGMLRVFGWYDNEWGFSNRMLDMAVRMG